MSSRTSDTQLPRATLTGLEVGLGFELCALGRLDGHPQKTWEHWTAYGGGLRVLGEKCSVALGRQTSQRQLPLYDS